MPPTGRPAERRLEAVERALRVLDAFLEVPGEAGSVRRAENAVWAYRSPYDEVLGLAGYYAFYPNRVDSIAVT